MIIYWIRFYGAKNLGKIYYDRCTKCHEKSWKTLCKGRDWLYSIIPLGKAYGLRCELCRREFKIKNDYQEYFLDHHRLTQSLLQGKITEEEYKEQVAHL